VPQLIESIKNLIFSENFCQRNKENARDFVRTRLLPFHELIFFFLNMNNQSYQEELGRYFQALHHADVLARALHKGNLFKARAKLKHEAFVELNYHLVNFFYDNFRPDTWFGFNLLAVDGSTLRLPHEADIADHFGVWKPTKGEKACPKARASQMFDVLKKITVDSIISPKTEGKRELAAFHFPKLQSRDLILLDRGYPAHWLFCLILSLGASFCARIPYNRWRVAQQFYLSGKKEQIAIINPSPQSLCKCYEMGIDKKPIKVRFIRVELDSGETEILVTTLMDKKKYPYELFSELYHLRWPVEEDFKALKYRLQVENFSGKTVRSVYQDFHAKIFSKNLVAAVATTTKQQILLKSEKLKHVHQINLTQALAKMKHTIILIFHQTTRKVSNIIEKLRAIFIQTTEAVRPNRKFPRRHRVKQHRFFFEFKTTC
jgi:IS4 transposase